MSRGKKKDVGYNFSFCAVKEGGDLKHLDVNKKSLIKTGMEESPMLYIDHTDKFGWRVNVTESFFKDNDWYGFIISRENSDD